MSMGPLTASVSRDRVGRFEPVTDDEARRQTQGSRARRQLPRGVRSRPAVRHVGGCLSRGRAAPGPIASESAWPSVQDRASWGAQVRPLCLGLHRPRPWGRGCGVHIAPGAAPFVYPSTPSTHVRYASETRVHDCSDKDEQSAVDARLIAAGVKKCTVEAVVLLLR